VTEPLIRNISDTARWVATYRARESERPNALFRDRFASRLADEHGQRIANSIPDVAGGDWPFVVRTYLFDRLIEDEVQRGADAVLNLAAGLDARPYRMTLPATLKWTEVDLPEMLDYKAAILANERPVCALERVTLDLAQVAERRELFARVARAATRTVILCEGLLVYLSAEEAGSLAEDLAAVPGAKCWAADIPSPGLLRMMLRSRGGEMVRQAGAPFKFAPPEGPAFFERYGWKPTAVESLFETAARLNRLPLSIRLLSLLPQRKGPDRIWSGVCRFEPIASGR
jgi:methyltransferase (TIGR00027 family)